MTAFGVATWDEVLDQFRPRGTLEGLWGWLEILRRASDNDLTMYGASDVMGGGGASVEPMPGNMGFFDRDESGHILVGGRTHSEFAAEGRGYIYSLLQEESSGTQSLKYSTPSTHIHHHLHWMRVRPDGGAALSDLSCAGLDVLGNVCIANVELAPASTVLGFSAITIGFAVDLGAAEKGAIRILSYNQLGYYDSSDVLGVLGLIPEVGIFTDFVSALSNLSGVRIGVTP